LPAIPNLGILIYKKGGLTMLTVNLEDFQGRILELINQAASGEPVVITQADRPLVKMVPYVSPQAPERLDCMRGHGFIGEDVDVKSIAREEIIAIFEGRDEISS
jgi:prevent-host-death family protein